MNILICAPINEKDIQRIQAEFPSYTYVVNAAPTAEQIEQADVVIGNPSLSLPINRESLQAILLNSAGSDQYIAEGVLHAATRLANASGSYGTAISEQVIGMILALTKNLKGYSLQTKAHEWNKWPTGKEIWHSRVCIVGYGDLGAETAKRLRAFDCHITAVKRRAQENLPYVDQVVTMEALDEVLAESDFVILTLPQNASTIGMFNRERLLKMKKDAVLINVGRGSAVVTDDLIAVMEDGHLFGAALDVTDPEPLPADSKLWDIDRVLITPHSSGGFVWESVHEHYTDLVIRNLHHLEAGEELENEVDVVTGYRKKVIYR